MIRFVIALLRMPIGNIRPPLAFACRVFKPAKLSRDYKRWRQQVGRRPASAIFETLKLPVRITAYRFRCAVYGHHTFKHGCPFCYFCMVSREDGS